MWFARSSALAMESTNTGIILCSSNANDSHQLFPPAQRLSILTGSAGHRVLPEGISFLFGSSTPEKEDIESVKRA